MIRALPSESDDLNFSSLHSLTFGARCRSHFDFDITFPRDKLRLLEVFCADKSIIWGILYGGLAKVSNPAEANPLSSSGTVASRFPNLEVLRCGKTPLPPDHLKDLIEPALRNGTLKVLEITHPELTHNPELSDNLLRGEPQPAIVYPFAASDNIHTVGMYDFWWSERYSANIDPAPFLDWLGHFPGVRTVAAYPRKSYSSSYLSFFAKLICYPGIEAIHQDVLQGVDWDQANELARKQGVKLYPTPERMPIGWPITD